MAKEYIKSSSLLLFEPLNFFLLNFFLIHGFGFFSYRTRSELGLTEYEHNYDLLIKALFVSILALILFQISFFIGSRGRSVFNHITLVNKSANAKLQKRNWALFVMLIIFSYSLFWWLIGGVPILIPGFHDLERTDLGKGLGLVEAMCNTLLSLSALFYLWKIKQNDRLDSFSILFFFCIILILTMNDARSMVIGYCISIVRIYYFCKKPLEARYYLVGAAFLVIFAGAIGIIRAGDSERNALRLGMEVSTEMSVEFDNYVESFNMRRDSKDLNGSTLVPIFTLPIPRAIFPDKDKYLTAGNYFKEYHDHSHIRVGERLTFIGELLINWGLLGVFIGSIILGFLMAMIVCGTKQTDSLIKALLIINFSVFPVGFIAGDIASNFVNFFMTNIWLIFYYYFKQYKRMTKYA